MLLQSIIVMFTVVMLVLRTYKKCMKYITKSAQIDRNA